MKRLLKKVMPASANTFNARTDRTQDSLQMILDRQQRLEQQMAALDRSLAEQAAGWEKRQDRLLARMDALAESLAALGRRTEDLSREIPNFLRGGVSTVREDIAHVLEAASKNAEEIKTVQAAGFLELRRELQQEGEAARSALQSVKAGQEEQKELCGAIQRNVNDSRERLIRVSEKRTSPNLPNHDVGKHLWELAAAQTAEFVSAHMAKCKTFPNPEKLREAAVSLIQIDGLYLEFGVYSGKSINQVADLKPEQTLYGFDSFQGLPETWRTGFYKNVFAKENLPELRPNVELVVGMFEDTLPTFAAKNPGPCAYIHVDCDLYSSTKTVFRYLKNQIVPGTVLVFDEFFNYPSWKDHEYKAFCELVEETGLSYEFIGYVPSWEQAAVLIR